MAGLPHLFVALRIRLRGNFDIIMEPDQSVCLAWTNIEDLYLHNKLNRAIFIEAKFRSLVQGDMTITEYCHTMKTFFDALHDVGQLVSDQTLVLNMLYGLNGWFSDMTTIIPM